MPNEPDAGEGVAIDVVAHDVVVVPVRIDDVLDRKRRELPERRESMSEDASGASTTTTPVSPMMKTLLPSTMRSRRVVPDQRVDAVSDLLHVEAVPDTGPASASRAARVREKKQGRPGPGSPSPDMRSDRRRGQDETFSRRVFRRSWARVFPEGRKRVLNIANIGRGTRGGTPLRDALRESFSAREP